MLSTQTPATTTSTSAARGSTLTLDSLAARSMNELDALYRAATVSSSMHAADGALIGRMLTVRGLPGAVAGPLRRWAASRAFVWEGKTFQASSDTHGVGHNRVHVPRALGRQNLFPFDTLFGPSAIDGKPTLILDYDLDVNPSYIRHIHDEIREVSPGLFLGPAMWKGAREKALVLWFALDSRLS
ncbi:MAG: hypothetical protein H0T46_13985 [Deltaproteobacteria bacterium]|nr:hypothetical protein [Deltaproteobacteria bacterium]